MPPKLKRYHGRGDLHFITFSCYERRALLGTVRARDLFLKILEQVRRRCLASVVGYVVMPEHVHLLLSEPRKGTLAKLLQVLKQRVSHAMRRRRRREVGGQLSLAFPVSSAGLRRFWQRRYYDFNVYSAQKIREKLDYIHTNPVRRKLVMHPKDWPWSSWAFYARGEQGAHPLQKPQRVGHPRYAS
jgi:putative transposase